MAQQYDTATKKHATLVMSAAALVIVLLVQAEQASGASLFDPWVSTGKSVLSPDGRHVGVNVPAIFNMILDTRGQNRGAKLDISVLLGLVRVNLDRERGADGRLHGPIHVSVGGFTMFDDGETSTSNTNQTQTQTLTPTETQTNETSIY